MAKKKIAPTKKEEPTEEQRLAIQEIYFDNTLTPTEKHARIKSVMGDAVNDSDSENMSIYTEGGAAMSRQGSMISIQSLQRNSGHMKSPTMQQNEPTIAEEGNPPARNFPAMEVFSENTMDAFSKASSDTDSNSYPTEEGEDGSRDKDDCNDDDDDDLELHDASRGYKHGGYKEVDCDEEGQSMNATENKPFADRKRRAFLFCACSLLVFLFVIGILLGVFWEWIVQDHTTSSAAKAGDATRPPNDAPTWSPTAEQTLLLYDPPTREQCDAVAAGTFEASSESTMLVNKTFQVPMDVSLEYETTDPDAMVAMLTESLQSKIAPQLVGCSDIADRRRLRNRQLSVDPAQSYIIANAKMVATYREQANCIEPSSTCYRVLVDITLFLHDGTESTTTTTLSLVSRIGNALAPTAGLVDELELPSPFSAIDVNAVTATFATESPSASPTRVPTTTADTVAPTPTGTISSPTQNPTVSPTVVGSATSAPTRDRKSIIEYALKDNEIKHANAKALKWLEDEDTYMYHQSKHKEDVADVMIERYALAAIFDQLQGDRWSDSSNWMTETSHCEWHGVGCDSEEYVTQLRLGGNGLSGQLPTEFGLLDDLITLDLDSNELKKDVVSEMVKLVNLKQLMLGNNELSGELPEALVGLTSLTVLKLDNNKFKRKLPGGIGQLSKLSILTMCKCITTIMKVLDEMQWWC
eukprot:scaffold5392_cov107-Cylindrotheca_fusiformis.AAC.3